MSQTYPSAIPAGTFSYRPDIDGLRGIAVSAVILFHANVTGFRGGFVGVDIFFVISGFLITAISLREWETGRFSVGKFFEKRARRILPALLLVILACVPFALTIPNPLQSRHFFESVLYVLSFSSNFHFWGQTGYFETSAELKPLLHTWSLAVEEQYYVLFPFMFLALVRSRKAAALLILTTGFVVSLALAQTLIQSGHKPAAFFLLPARIWELLAGVFCALAYRGGVNARFPGKAADLLAGAGLILVLVSFPVFNDNTVTPGAHALIPVTGAALIILFSRSGRIVYRILSNKPLVFLGLISFSAYLWHQPIFAFARLFASEPLSAWVMAVLCLLILPLAYVSWRFVEVPFRNRESVSLALSFRTAFAAMAVLVVVSTFGVRTYGFVYFRYAADVAETYETVLRSISYDFEDAMHDNGDCVFSSMDIDAETEDRFARCADRYGPATVVIGDSHGMNIYNVLAKTEAFDFLLGLATHGHQAHKAHTENWYYRHVLPFVERHKENIDKVVYHQTASTFWNRKDDPSTRTAPDALNGSDVEKVAEFMDDLSAYTKTVWLGPYPDFGHDPVKAVFDLPSRKMAQSAKEQLVLLDQAALESAQGRNFIYAKFADLYPMPDSPFFDRCVLFRDSDHLTSCGEKIVAEWIAATETLNALSVKKADAPMGLEAGS
ncbi:peptidoglycan/LPS O-acetylase OafA/YrhL [Labrenzia sp. MBR-25]